MEKVNFGTHNVTFDLSNEEVAQIVKGNIPKQSFIGKFISRTFNSLGTTVTGISLHYDLIINGFVTKDYVMMGKGLISVLALSYCEDPKFKTESESTQTQ